MGSGEKEEEKKDLPLIVPITIHLIVVSAEKIRECEVRPYLARPIVSPLGVRHRLSVDSYASESLAPFRICARFYGISLHIV